MKAMRQIFAKDLRRLRWPLIVWLGAVIGRVSITALRSDLAFGEFGLQVAVDNVSTLLTILDLLLLVLLVSWLVHDEPLIGYDAFWLTRPIRPTLLMTEKLLFAAVFFILAAAVGRSIAVAIITRSLADSARIIPIFLFTQALWVAGLVAIATLTPSLTRFLLTIVAAAAVIAGGLSVMTTVLLMTAEVDNYYESIIPDTTALIVGSWLLLAVALAVIVSQYRTRRIRRAVFGGIAGLIVTAWLADVWPWRFARPIEPDPGAWAHDTAKVAAVLDPNEPYVTDAFFFGRGGSRKKQVAASIHLSGMPPTYDSESMAVRSRLEFADGSALESAQSGTVPVRRGNGASDYRTRLQAALAPARLLLSASDGVHDQWPVVLTVTDAEYERYGRMAGRLTTTMNVFLREYRLVGSIPLADGATLQGPSSRFEVRRVLRRSDGCSVLVRQSADRSVGRAGVMTSYHFALRNTGRGEALLGDSEWPVNRSLHFGGWSVDTHVMPGLAFSDVIAHYPSRVSFEAAPQVDAAWLDGAELAVIEAAYAGRVTRSLAVEGFSMRR